VLAFKFLIASINLFYCYYWCMIFYLFIFFACSNRASIVKSLDQLFLLGALTDECKLSDVVGHQMAQLPLDPIYSRALILASQFNCLEEC
jgi:ATP-dependent RNA helicase DHX8/PRP22